MVDNTLQLVTQLIAVTIKKRTYAYSSASTADTGRHDVSIRFALTEGGAAIGALSQGAVETPVLGTYQATFSDADLVAGLSGLRGKPIVQDTYLGDYLYASEALLVE